MFEIDDLIELLNEKEIWNELNLTKQEFKKAMKLSMKDEAKSLVADCFRNGPLEDLHAKGKISQEEMKELMKYAVNRMFYWLWLKKNSNFLYNFELKAYHLIYSNGWDDPDIDVEEQLRKSVEAVNFSGRVLISKAVHDKKEKEKIK